MKKEPDIVKLLQAVRNKQDKLVIYDKQMDELRNAISRTEHSVKSLQLKIDNIQAAKETRHLTALELATARGIEFPAVEGRVYRTESGNRYEVTKHPETSLLSITRVQGMLEYMSGYDAETLALHFFYIHPKAIVVGAGI